MLASEYRTDMAISMGHDLQRVPYRDRSWLGYKTRTSELFIFFIYNNFTSTATNITTNNNDTHLN